MATEGTGENSARELGQGWKVSPSAIVKSGEIFTIGEIQGPGVIQHIWLTCHPNYWRTLIFRIYWDGEASPSVEAPVGDFFCNGWCERSNVNSIPIAVNPAGGMNSYWEMPFKAQWRRSNPLGYKEVHTILDHVTGKGHYVGTYLGCQPNNTGWWGEGEIKFYMDGDREFPTICGTGTEDYFGGAWSWEQPQGQYCTYSAAFLGMHQLINSDGSYRSQQRFGMYRWHVVDPIRFNHDLKVTIQLLGWRSNGRYLPLQSDVFSVAYWYQAEPHNPFNPLPDRDGLEVI